MSSCVYKYSIKPFSLGQKDWIFLFNHVYLTSFLVFRTLKLFHFWGLFWIATTCTALPWHMCLVNLYFDHAWRLVWLIVAYLVQILRIGHHLRTAAIFVVWALPLASLLIFEPFFERILQVNLVSESTSSNFCSFLGFVRTMLSCNLFIRLFHDGFKGRQIVLLQQTLPLLFRLKFLHICGWTDEWSCVALRRFNLWSRSARILLPLTELNLSSALLLFNLWTVNFERRFVIGWRNTARLIVNIFGSIFRFDTTRGQTWRIFGCQTLLVCRTVIKLWRVRLHLLQISRVNVSIQLILLI